MFQMQRRSSSGPDSCRCHARQRHPSALEDITQVIDFIYLFYHRQQRHPGRAVGCGFHHGLHFFFPRVARAINDFVPGACKQFAECATHTPSADDRNGFVVVSHGGLS